MKRSALILLLILINLGLSSSVQAQSGSTTGSIVGTVSDPQGAVIVGATVKAKQQETNLERTVQVGEGGAYQLLQLPPGHYQLVVSADGFNPVSDNITLTIGATLLSEFRLGLTGSTEVIEVNANNSLNEIKTESSNVNNSDRIDSLPINRRDFLDFSLTSPRVTLDRVPNQGILSTSGLSFNGQSGRFNNVTIDGLDNNDTNQGSVRATFSQDAVQEFQVVSDSYSAEFGRALAGVVNIVTKSGGNEFYGNLFFLNRNDNISARDAFTPVKPPYSQYQFGTALSGPIKKDKAFFFTSFERLTIKQNNIVTISDASVQAAQRLGYMFGNGPQPFSLGTTSLLARADVRLGANDTFWVRYNGGFSYNGAFEPFGGLISRSNSGKQSIDDNSIAFNNTYISPALNLLNETRFLYSRRNQGTVPLDKNAGVQLSGDEGTIAFGNASFLPEFNNQRIYQIVDNVSLSRGRHQIKAGVDFVYIDRPAKPGVSLFPGGFGLFAPLDFAVLFGQPGLPAFSGLQAFDPSLRTPAQRGFLTFLSTVLPSSVPGFPQNVPLADIPLPTIYAQGFGNTSIQLKEKFFSTFAQDDIRLRPNLLLRVGLRYDIVRLDFTPKNSGNFSPRVAFAYRPAKLPKLNIHAAYGLFFAPPFARAAISSQSSTLGLKVLFIPFPGAVLPFALPGHKFPESNQLPAGVSFIPQLNILTQYQPNLRASYSQQASLGLDYLLGNKTTVSLTYNYVRGLKLVSLRNINPVIHPVPNNSFASLLSGRIDPTKGDTFEFESGFDSYYNAFSVIFNRQLTNNISFLAHYTFSKAIDNIVDFSASVTDRQDDSLRIGNERGLSVQDTRSRFVFSGNWQLNYSKNIFLRDFQLSAILNLNSGQPYNLLAGTDINMNGDGGIGDRAAGLGRNVGITPGYANLDMRLTRTIAIKERYRIQGLVEIFNIFNRVNIAPNEINRLFPADAQGNFQLPPKQGGRYTLTPDRYRGSFPAREFQVGFRLTF